MKKAAVLYLKCPKCLGGLKTKSLKGRTGESAQVEQCYGCKGIWFNKGELKLVLKMTPVFKTGENPKEFYGSWRDVIFDLKKAACPDCKKEMKRFKKKGIPVSLDICRTCKGLWVDGGEIRFLQKGQPVRKAARYLFYQMKDVLKKAPLAKRLKRNF